MSFRPICISVLAAPPPDVEDLRRALMLNEDRLGHYAEFREFFISAFDLKSVLPQRSGYLQGPSGTNYELVFISRSGEPSPSGLDIFALIPALEPCDESILDRDLWEILRWMIDGIGLPWTLEAVDATGKLYKIPAADG
jgi:hypothetical protein